MKPILKNKKKSKLIFKIAGLLFLVYIISFFIILQVKVQKKKAEAENLKNAVTAQQNENNKLAEILEESGKNEGSKENVRVFENIVK